MNRNHPVAHDASCDETHDIDVVKIRDRVLDLLCNDKTEAQDSPNGTDTEAINHLPRGVLLQRI